MKTNKFLILAIMLISALTSINAQSFHVYRNSGNVSDFTIADVDSIVFDAPEDEGPRFHLKYSGLTSTSVTLSVTPEDNSVAYYYDCVTKEQLEESNGSIASVVEGYLSYLQQRYPTLSMENILEAILSKGPATDDVKGLPAGTDFIFYAIPVNKEGKCYGKPTTKNFSTLPGGDPAECTFDISYTDLTADGCNVIIKPSDPSVRYWMGITPFKDYPGDKALAMDVKENIESYAQSKGMTVAQVVKGVTFTDNIESQESGLDLNTSYYIYAYAMNEDASAAGKIYKLKFTTRASGASDADISIKYRYYDGDDLYNMDPTKYANMKGRVYMQSVVTPNDDAAHWAVALAKGDFTDETMFPDESTKNAVLQGGYLSATQKNFVADWTTCTLLYFAADAAGVDGELHRLLVDFKKEGASPISTFTETVEAPAQVSRLLVPRRQFNSVARRMMKKGNAAIHRTLVK